MIGKGVTRLVFGLGDSLVVKIPNFTFSHSNFLRGCIANWNERNYYKLFSKMQLNNEHTQYVAPCYYCAPFGLFSLYARCRVNKRELTELELSTLSKYSGGDNKPTNFGYYKGRLVCLDYPN